MRLIKQEVEIMDLGTDDPKDILKKLEIAGRTCYKSCDKVTDVSSEKFVKMIMNNHHESVLEHHNITVKFITDRAILGELVRHRLASFSVESTRYVKYNNIRFISPVDFELTSDDLELLLTIEKHYEKRILEGLQPQQARYFLPNGLKTEIIVTANIRQWRHILSLRLHKSAHNQIRDLMQQLLKQLVVVPVLFDDLYDQYIKEN